jgi:ParB-like chromosome segregation protein Spo0J
VHFDPVASEDPSSSSLETPPITDKALIGRGVSAPHDDPPARGREGLPPKFRMRHARHYVEQLMGDAPLRTVRDIAIADIEPPPSDPVDLGELERSIREVGVLEPLLVTPSEGRFVVIGGANRLRAAASVGLRTVPCLVHEADVAMLHTLREAVRQRVAAPPGDASPVSAAQADAQTSAALAEVNAGLNFASVLLSAMEAAGQDAFRRGVLGELVGVELQRAKSIAAATELLAGSPQVSRSDARIGDLIERALHAVRTEARLRGSAIEVVTNDPEFRLPLDAAIVGTALRGMVYAMLALPGPSGVRFEAKGTTVRPALIIELSNDAAVVEGDALRRFFDAEWSEHPCGAAGAVMLAGAAHAARLHGGRADVRIGTPSGCTVTFVVPRVSG